MATLRNLVARLSTGSATVDDIEAALRATPPTPRPLRSAEEIRVADGVGDYDLPPVPPNGFDHVYSAYMAGLITDADYARLQRAAAGAR